MDQFEKKTRALSYIFPKRIKWLSYLREKKKNNNINNDTWRMIGARKHSNWEQTNYLMQQQQ